MLTALVCLFSLAVIPMIAVVFIVVSTLAIAVGDAREFRKEARQRNDETIPAMGLLVLLFIWDDVASWVSDLF